MSLGSGEGLPPSPVTSGPHPGYLSSESQPACAPVSLQGSPCQAVPVRREHGHPLLSNSACTMTTLTAAPRGIPPALPPLQVGTIHSPLRLGLPGIHTQS